MTPEINDIDHNGNVTVRDVLIAVESIRSIAVDDERAHAAEDDLRRAVLLAISEGRLAIGESTPDVAAAALRSAEIKFGRWCA